MESSVLQMGSRKCFVAAVVFIVGWDDPRLEEHLSLVEHFISLVEKGEGLCDQQSTHVRKQTAGMRGCTK